MKCWQNKLKEIPGPHPAIAFVNLAFILLLIFLLSSNFVSLAGITSKSAALLPTLKSADIKIANKIIVTVSKRLVDAPAEAAATEGKQKILTYEYSFNGDSVLDAEALRPKIGDAIRRYGLKDNTSQPEEVMIVLMASKDIPYEKLIEFYALSRDFNVPLYLVTNDGEQEDPLPRRMQSY